MTTLDLLEAARCRIAQEEYWTQFAYARNAAGTSVAFDDPGAVLFDCEGAVLREARIHNASYWTALSLLDKASAQYIKLRPHIISLNDGHTHAVVMDVIQAAIDMAAQDTSALAAA